MRQPHSQPVPTVEHMPPAVGSQSWEPSEHGWCVGEAEVGATDGSRVGASLGAPVGATLGLLVGAGVGGGDVGRAVGAAVGASESTHSFASLGLSQLAPHT